MIGPVALQPFLVGILFALRHGLRRLAGRSRRQELWDLRCRRAFFGGLLGAGFRG
jgi:hypothetical protein